MGISGHVLTSVGAYAVTFAVTNSILVAVCVAAGSLLLDLDHLFDYFVVDRQRSLNPFRFLHYYGYSTSLRRLLLLHSYELLAFALACGLLAGSRVLVGFVAGAFIHLGADILPGNAAERWRAIKQYSFSYRWYCGFHSSRIYG